MRSLLFIGISLFFGYSYTQTTGTITDARDGKVYKTIVIGNQTWMAENLNVDRFRNGDVIPEAKTKEEWVKAGQEGKPVWCYYDNDPKNGVKYGKLYNWYSVNDPRGLAPEGYHIPSRDDWKVIADYLGSSVGEKMKSEAIYETKIRYEEVGGYDETKWVTCNNCKVASPEYKKICPSCKGMGGKTIKTGKYIPKTKRKVEDKIQIGGWDGTNESGFSSLPGGQRYGHGTFDGIKNYANWWSNTSADYITKYKGTIYTNLAWYNSLEREFISLHCDDNGAYRDDGHNKGRGFSVRCIQDFKNNFSISTIDKKDNSNGVGNGESDGFNVGTRTILNHPILPKYKSEFDGKIYLMLTINSDGDVVNAKHIQSKTSILDKSIINDVISQVKQQMKYSKDPNSELSITYFTINISSE